MSFFKRLFSSKKQKSEPESDEEGITFTGIGSSENFEQRYKEQVIAPDMLDGCLKMIDSYFIENNIERKVPSPINHPFNLDQVDREGFDFVLFCKAYGMGEEQAVLFLAFAFSDFLINKYGFTLYRDATPEQPLRGMTLKYNNDNVFLSLYPYEYASKVLNGNESFSEFEEKINNQLSAMPDVNDIIDKYLGEGGND